MTRVVELGATRDFNEALWQCLCQIMRISPTQAEDIRRTASLPLVLGGMGLRSAIRVRQAAYWSSWADCLPMVHQRHPGVAATLVAQLSGNPETRFLSAAREAKHELAVAGFESPSWKAIARGARPARDSDASVATCGCFSGGRTGQSSHVHQSVRPGEGPREVTRRSRGRSSLHSNANLHGNDHPFPLVSGSLASQTSSAFFPSRVVRADVAVSSTSSTSLATIVLHVLALGC